MMMRSSLACQAGVVVPQPLDSLPLRLAFLRLGPVPLENDGLLIKLGRSELVRGWDLRFEVGHVEP